MPWLMRRRCDGGGVRPRQRKTDERPRTPGLPPHSTPRPGCGTSARASHGPAEAPAEAPAPPLAATKGSSWVGTVLAMFGAGRSTSREEVVACACACVGDVWRGGRRPGTRTRRDKAKGAEQRTPVGDRLAVRTRPRASKAGDNPACAGGACRGRSVCCSRSHAARPVWRCRGCAASSSGTRVKAVGSGWCVATWDQIVYLRIGRTCRHLSLIESL